MKIADITESEQDEYGRAMVRAAFHAFGEFPGDHEDVDRDEIARRVVRALAAAAEAESVELNRLRDVKDGHLILLTGTSVAVATAFWLWSEQVDLDIDEVCPDCVAGSIYLGFAHGMAAARHMNEALRLMEFPGYGATRLADVVGLTP
jgi:hypothetical protein